MNDVPEIVAIVFKPDKIRPSGRTVIPIPSTALIPVPDFFRGGIQPINPCSTLSYFYMVSLVNVERTMDIVFPFKSRTMCQYGAEHIPSLTYCRQHLFCESVFHVNSRVAQEWMTDVFSKHDEHTLVFSEPISKVQKRIAFCRSIRESTTSQIPGKLMPASFHGSPAQRKNGTEDALAITNRCGQHHLMISRTCNPDWPDIPASSRHGKHTCDRPDLCCREYDCHMYVSSKNVASPMLI